jgi:phosphoesterase RecJ-like protein
MTWDKLQSIIDSNGSFLLSSHVNPDGDSICSQLAFYWYVTSRGKDAVIYNVDAVPSKFSFLRGAANFTSVKPERAFDVFVILDASNTSRLGWDTASLKARVTVNIDHHRDNGHQGHLNIVNHDAAATSELLYAFFHDTNVDFPPEVASTLYAGILTDTGGFQFSNTNSRILRICAELAEKGADCSTIYRHVYTSFSPAGLLLRAKIWSTLTFYDNNRISTMEMAEEDLTRSGANSGDIEGMSDQALTAAGVEVGMFIKHTPTHAHISLRSTGRIDVGKLAQTIPGGGGHTCAAGCTIQLPLAQAKAMIIALIEKELG